MQSYWFLFHLVLVLANEANGTPKLITSGEPSENSYSISASSELKASYSTTCSNILSLAYSPHNTLVATGVASSIPATAGISALTSINSIRASKPLHNLGLPSSATINSSNSQTPSAGFTKIFINGTGTNSSKWHVN